MDYRHWGTSLYYTEDQSRTYQSLAFASNDTKLLIAYDDFIVEMYASQKFAEKKWCFHAENPSEPEHS